MTVIARRLKASPVRTASAVWQTIVDLLAPIEGGEARVELTAITGIACATITAEAEKTAPIVVTGEGPMVRIYCLYDEDAMTGDSANENKLPVNVTANNWAMSLPCPSEDLEWIKAALARKTSRVIARDMTTEPEFEPEESAKTATIVDEEAFFRS